MYKILQRYQDDSNWAHTHISSSDLEWIIRRAEICARDPITYGMVAVLDITHNVHVVQFSAGDAKPVYIDPNYRSVVAAALEQQVEVQKVEPVNKCPDCKDGFYYPLVGPKEPCPTCKS